jgi:hypothetical protein
MDEGAMMPADECTNHILRAIQKKNTGAHLYRQTNFIHEQIFSGLATKWFKSFLQGREAC